MNKLSEKELMQINGGGALLWLALGGLAVFVIGMVDGYVRPLACNY